MQKKKKKKCSPWPASLIILGAWTYAQIVTSGSVLNKWVRRERSEKKTQQTHPAPSHFFPSVWSHLLFFLAHTKSSEVEPGRWWGYSLGKMCSNVISFQGAHGAERKDGLWYFCLLNLMVGLWHLYLLNVRNLIHHCWQSEHVLCGWHNCLFLQSDRTFILIWETKKRWRKKRIRPRCCRPREMRVEISVIVFEPVMFRSIFLVWAVSRLDGAVEG